MKKYALHTLLLCSMVWVCNCKPRVPMVQSKDALPVAASENSHNRSFVIDTSQSFVYWEGRQGLARIVTKHTGSFGFQSGSIQAKDNQLVNGQFVIDITSLKNFDLKNPSRRDVLVRHLKSEDFFDAARFPTASFELISAERQSGDSLQINGNLTLKGITKSIGFPANVIFSEKGITAHAKFYINRKDWGINWHSEASVGNGIIRPEVGIELKIVTK